MAVYDYFLDNSGINTAPSVGWNNNVTQEIRFKTLYDIGIDIESKVLDFGCGVGHFFDYISKLGHCLDNYVGIDINQRSISIAQQTHPDISFKTCEIFDLSDHFDYVIGSGVFTVKMLKSDIMGAIDYAYKICNKGLAFNFLTEEYVGDYKVMFNGFNPISFYKEIQNRYPNSVLIMGYLGNEDFTIYIKKI